MIMDLKNADFADRDMIKALQEGASEVETGIKVNL